MGVNEGGFNVVMPQKILNEGDIGSVFKLYRIETG
jgi:hypothetical protein